MFDLKGKRALVTGASGGLGEGIALSLAAAGAQIILSGTRKEALESLQQKMGNDHSILPCNLKNPEEVSILFEQAENSFGPIDILVNNAGITRDGLLVRMKDQDFQEVLEVNLEAPFKLMRSAVKSMMKRRRGRLINITSVVGVTGNPGQANYCASKAGLIGMTKSIALEVASRHITANCIAPGFMLSPMTEALTEDQHKHLLSSIPLGCMGDAKDIGSAVVFLASDEAHYITGQTLHVNGGLALV